MKPPNENSASKPAHQAPGALHAFRDSLRRVVESWIFQTFIAIVILLNAASLGLETSKTAVRLAGNLFDWMGTVTLVIFTIELSLRLGAYGWQFFKRGWNLFDFFIVLVTAVPAWPNLSVLRAFRILRTMRFFSIIPRLRSVVQAMVMAIPSMTSILFLLLLWFYIAAVLATQFFGNPFDAWFGNVGRSMYSLFQIMTLESWSMGIVRPVMEVYPAAWVFFVPFIIVTTFTMLNLIVAFLVNAAQSQQQAEQKSQEATIADPPLRGNEALIEQISVLHREMAELRKYLEVERERMK